MFARKVTQEIKAFILEHKDVADAKLAEIIKDKFNVQISYRTVMHHKGYKIHCRCKPTFLTKPVGTERINKDGYIYVTVENGKERLKHHIVWEKNHKPIKKDEIIVFLDGNKQNCDINNLISIKRKYICALNRIYGGLANVEPELRKTALMSVILLCESKEKGLKTKKVRPRDNSWKDVVMLHLAGKNKSEISKSTGKNNSVIAWILQHYKAGCYDIN